MANLTDDQQAALIRQQRLVQAPHDALTIAETKITLLETLIRETGRVAAIDNLTGLPNAAFCNQLLSKAYDEVGQVGLVRIDLNKFKQVNDQYGHLAGDKVLSAVGIVLKTFHEGDIPATRLEADNLANLGQTVTAFRPGGDEFVLLITGHSREDAINLANQARLEVASIKHDVPVDVSGSFGVTWYDAGQGKPLLEKLITMADDASYAAKKQDGHPLCMVDSPDKFYRIDDQLDLIAIPVPDKITTYVERREPEVKDRRGAQPQPKILKNKP